MAGTAVQLERLTSQRSDRYEDLHTQDTRGNVTHDGASLRNYDSHAVPPADVGPNAWLFLAGCFAVEALIWGVPFTYGGS